MAAVGDISRFECADKLVAYFGSSPHCTRAPNTPTTEFIAWLIGWCLTLEWLFSVSVCAISWSGYVIAALKDTGWPLPAVISAVPFMIDAHNHLTATGAWFNLPATRANGLPAEYHLVAIGNPDRRRLTRLRSLRLPTLDASSIRTNSSAATTDMKTDLRQSAVSSA